LIIDAWIPQGPTEWIGTLPLDGGKQYPLKLEFFEEAGGAVCLLFWSSGRIARSIVPRSQLYPEKTSAIYPTTSFPLKVYPNPVDEVLMLDWAEEDLYETLDVQITNVLGQTVLFPKVIVGSGLTQIDVRSIPSGLYWLRCRKESGELVVMSFVKL
jgi:hypothetical protein